MIIRADARFIPLRNNCVDCCVTSPPYFGLRDYGNPQQIGLEPTPDAFVASLVAVFREVKRVLKDSGTLWLNLGDSYAGSGRGAWDVDDAVKDAAGVKEVYRPRKHPISNTAREAAMTRSVGDDRLYGFKAKDLMGIPWRVAFALQADDWYLRSDIIWSKPNPMPESVTDRPTKAHEYLFLLAKSARYYYDAEAIAEAITTEHWSPAKGQNNYGAAATSANDFRTHARSGGGQLGNPSSRNKRSVWTVPTLPYAGAHFATMPEALVEPCVLAGCPAGGLVLDPFLGSGTVGAVSERLDRRWVGTDLSYQSLASERTAQRGLMFTEQAV